MNKRIAAALSAAAVAALLPSRPAAADAPGSATCSAVITSSFGTYSPLRSTAGVAVRPATVRVTCGVISSVASRAHRVTVDIAPSPGGHVMHSAYGTGKPLKYEIYMADGKIWADGTAGTGHFVSQFAASGTQLVPVEIHIAGGQDATVGRYADASLTFVVGVSDV